MIPLQNIIVAFDDEDMAVHSDEELNEDVEDEETEEDDNIQLRYQVGA
jgi:hypothetical protein